jgi:hypothetical protein
VLTKPLSSSELFRVYSFSRIRVLASRCLEMHYSEAMSPSLSRIRVLTSRCLTMNSSGFQASCHNICP